MVIKHEFYLINDIIRCVFFLYIVNLIAHGTSVIFFPRGRTEIMRQSYDEAGVAAFRIMQRQQAAFANKNRDE